MAPLCHCDPHAHIPQAVPCETEACFYRLTPAQLQEVAYRILVLERQVSPLLSAR